MNYRILLYICLVYCTPLLSQNSDFEIFQYTIDEGLPSNECHDVVKDKNGYLWIATDRGLARYDGYGFKNYGLEEGLEDLSCLDLFLDEKGRIWITTYSKKVYVYDPGRDRIEEYRFNDVLARTNIYNSVPLDLYVDADDGLQISIYNLGLFRIDSSGVVVKLSEKIIDPFFVHTTDDQLFFGSINLKPSFTSRLRWEEKPELSINVNGRSLLLESSLEPFFYGFPLVRKFKDGSVYLGLLGHNYLIKKDSVLVSSQAPTFLDLEVLHDGRIVTGELFNRGLKIFNDVSSVFVEDYEVLIPEVSVSEIFFSGQDLFVTTTDQGVYYLKFKSFNEFGSNEFLNNKITGIAVSQNEHIYALIDEDKLVRYDLSTGISNRIKLSLKEYFSLCYNDDNSGLYVGGNPISYFIDKDELSNSSDIEDVALMSYYNQGKSIFQSDSTSMIIVNSQGFTEFDANGNSSKFKSYDVDPNFRCNTLVKMSEGAFLTGGVNGLNYIDTTKWFSLDSIHPLFGIRINDIKKSGNQIYLGTQGSGVLIWDQKDSVRIINKSKGLLSNNVENLHLINETRLAVGTYSGLSILNLDAIDRRAVENYTVHNGLPANDIYDMVSLGDSLFVGTGRGMALITSKLSAESHKPPLIQGVSVNREAIDSKLTELTFDHDQNNIEIAYKSLDLSMRGDIDYEFTLNDDEWSRTKNTSVNLAAMQPGKYKFKVRSANRDGEWGEAVHLDFIIKKPWWRTGWFYILMGLLSVFGLYVLYKGRIRIIEKENKIQNEMSKLERSALQAQMNPHFIFNCLNSIQSFIMSNEKEKAMDYLSKFARLIRQNLEISVDSKLYLSEEIDMLTNYIELERARFNNAFNYKISVSNDINQERIVIPPLLIQPYVENAILHGMQGKQGGGMLKIIFEKEKDILKVVVRDNGPGIKEEKVRKHRSLGMSITQKRLDFINAHNKGSYDIQQTSDESGTEIAIDIALG